MKMLHQKIHGDLLRHENKQAAEEDKKYHKYDGHRSLGIKAPVLDELLKKYKAEIKALSCKEAFALAQMLYKDKIEETILAGNFVLQNKIDCIGKSELPFLDKALDCFCSWSTIDDFCIDVLQPVLLKYPKDTLRFLKKWNRSKNMWKRRVSVVAFVRKVGESGKFTNEALVLCENLIWDKEDLVQKGVGWCLKDIMRGDKKTVFDYVKKLRKRGVPATITLYAIRGLKSKERTEILRATPGKATSDDVLIGRGNLAGKGVYANKDFKKGEVVIQYHLILLTEEDYERLPKSEKMFTHTHWGQIMLYSEPERYVNHSKNPNTYQDLNKQQDIALRDIKKGEMITGDATKDDIE
ncbi:MAG: DNA alkylation repair protein [bacterium]|nr:DNA alkylation repair protein [bacterium]